MNNNFFTHLYNSNLVMKRVHFIAIILFGLINPLMANPVIKDSTEAYQYWAQRGIIEIVHAHMSDYINTVGVAKSTEENVTRKDYKLKFINNINGDTLSNLSDISQFLKTNKWGGVERNLLQPLIINLQNKHPLDADFFEVKNPETNQLVTDITGQNNERINWNKKKVEILDGYKKELINLANLKNVSAENLYTFDDDPKLFVSTKQSLILLLIFICGGIIGGWIVFYFSKRRIYSILEEERVYYLDYPPLKTEKSIFHYITLFHVLKRRKDSYKNHSRTLKNQMDNMELENQKLKDKLENKL
ncbi:MAG: hypothetical protein PHN55_00090 [Dysgonamonadaceae bacterium]|nr:hypothetical protein [Dysgonamonadaceae bacterium]